MTAATLLVDFRFLGVRANACIKTAATDKGYRSKEAFEF